MSKIIRLRNIKRALAIREPSQDVSYQISGRISAFRPYKLFNFVDITDGSTKDHLQLIIKRESLHKPQLGAFITCQGKLCPSKGDKQSLEFKASEIKFLGECDPSEYPLAIGSKQSNDWYRRYIHLRPRATHFASLLRVKSEMELSLHMIMKQMDFFRVHTPCLSSNDSEASSDLFLVKRSKVYDHVNSGLADLNGDEAMQEDEVGDEDKYQQGYDCKSDENDCGSSTTDIGLRHGKRIKENSNHTIRDDYFNQDVFLVTSAQLHLENLASALSRVYCLSSGFRAENSVTRRHLCEFLMFEIEESNLDELEPLMQRAETVVKFMAHYLSQVSEHRADLDSLLRASDNKSVYEKMSEASYIRMSHRQALESLSRMSDFSGDVRPDSDITRLHEKRLLEFTGNVPIFITHYPKNLKPFYMKCDQEDRVALCFDLIAPYGGEICGGSLREESHDKLVSNLSLRDASLDSLARFNWYLDSRRFGTFPHGGFGMGLERLLQSLLGIKNIKDTTAFPRWAGRCPM